MIYNRNKEGYPDPTAGMALANIIKQERFEQKRKYKRKHKTKRTPKPGESDKCIRLPYEQLANAIVIYAVEDYRIVLKRCMKQPGDKKVQKERQKLERFFRSDWYKILTSVDGEKLMEKIKEEMGYDS